MAKKDRKKKKGKPPGSNKNRLNSTETGETALADALTTFWVLATLTVAVCDLIALCARWYLGNPSQLPEDDLTSKLALAYGFFYFAAVIVGLLSLCLLPVMLKLRRRSVPRGVLLFSIIVSAAPVLMALVQIVMNS